MNNVDEVILQDSWDYGPILRKLRPDYVVHGDDWKTGIQKEKRDEVLEIIKEWGGELIEPAYYEGIPKDVLEREEKRLAVRPEFRRKRLRKLIDAKPIVRVLEAHNGLSALIVEKAKVKGENGLEKEFDAIWVSSLTDSTAKGKPDIELVDSSSRINTIEQMLEVTTKPIIVDGDSGGLTEHFVYRVKTLERLGISAIIIEDKVGLKKNSLFGTDVKQTQASIEDFSYKISQGKKAQHTNSFMIIARIESFILKNGLQDALSRAKAYIEAGADAIMIHSKENSPEAILDFCNHYKNFEKKVPLVAVPSTYNEITEEELKAVGISIVIYANHLIRSAYSAMVKTSETILKNERSYELNEGCMSIKEILELIPGGK